jgi:hypothetical protein
MTFSLVRGARGYRPHPRHWLALAELMGVSSMQRAYKSESLKSVNLPARIVFGFSR